MLILRVNGNTAANVFTAAWVNDFYNLLTGIMSDQPITIQQSVASAPITIPAVGAATFNAVAGSWAPISSTYKYGISFCATGGASPTYGESAMSSIGQITTPGAGAPFNIDLSAIPTGPAGTVQRLLYRTKVGGSTYFMLATLADNTTTTYVDSQADAGLSTQQNATHSFFGGTFWATDPTLAHWCGYSRDTISCGQGLMIRHGDGTLNTPAMAEFKTSGDLLIAGTHYSSTGVAALQNSQTFDSFDLAEVYQCDHDYTTGTVVCPDALGVFTMCTHAGCDRALITSRKPGYCIGLPCARDHSLPLALAGRVNVKGVVHIGQWVMSDGYGGVMRAEEGGGMAIGFVVRGTVKGMVGIVIRNKSV